MKLIRYKGTLGSGVALEDGTVCRKGEAVAVADALAERLIIERPDDFALIEEPKPKEVQKEK